MGQYWLELSSSWGVGLLGGYDMSCPLPACSPVPITYPEPHEHLTLAGIFWKCKVYLLILWYSAWWMLPPGPGPLSSAVWQLQVEYINAQEGSEADQMSFPHLKTSKLLCRLSLVSIISVCYTWSTYPVSSAPKPLSSGLASVSLLLLSLYVLHVLFFKLPIPSEMLFYFYVNRLWCIYIFL